nr:MAG TPA: DNA polymerase A [Caudoviricetes sp.]
MSKLIYVYASAVQKCIHIRVTDAWLKKVKMAIAIGITLDGYCIDGSRIKRKNQRNISSTRGDTDDMFKGYDVFLNKHGMWEFKKHRLQGVVSGRWSSNTGSIQNLPKV